jgi:hypothetical protein
VSPKPIAKWSRSDKVASLAFVVSAIGLLVSGWSLALQQRAQEAIPAFLSTSTQGHGFDDIRFGGNVNCDVDFTLANLGGADGTISRIVTRVELAGDTMTLDSPKGDDFFGYGGIGGPTTPLFSNIGRQILKSGTPQSDTGGPFVTSDYVLPDPIVVPAHGAIAAKLRVLSETFVPANAERDWSLGGIPPPSEFLADKYPVTITVSVAFAGSSELATAVSGPCVYLARDIVDATATRRRAELQSP